MRHRRSIVTLACLLAAAGCGRGGAPRSDAALRPTAVTSPAPTRTAEPNLATAGGRVFLSWLARDGDTASLQYSVHDRGAWSAPRTVTTGDSLFVNWADFPSLVQLADGSLAAHWLRKRGGEKFAYDVRIARSTDGATWPAGSMPHRDGLAVEHGFVSLVPEPLGGLTAVWLDGREYAGKEEGDPSAQTHLMAADLGPQGLGDERLLDGRVCDCCQTTAVRTSRGVLVAYRDRSPDEVRDIWLVRREGDTWTEPYPLAIEGWTMPGCPVNGPALAAAGLTAAAAWFTMAGDTARVEVALSSDAGATFSRPVRVDEGKPLGRVDIALLPGGDVLVVWMETADDGQTFIRARRVRRDLHAEDAFPVAATSAQRAAGFPHVVLAGRTLWFAWTSDADPSQVQVATLPVPRAWR